MRKPQPTNRKSRRAEASRRRKRGRTAALAIIASLGVGVAGGASAVTANENDFGGDFADTFGTATVLPDETDIVIGDTENLTQGVSESDWIEFSDLVAGTSFSASFNIEGDFNAESSASATDNLGSVLDQVGTGTGNRNFTLTGTVPNNGRLLLGLSFLSIEGPSTAPYSINLDATYVPEPGTLTLAAAGLAGLAAARGGRKRR